MYRYVALNALVCAYDVYIVLRIRHIDTFSSKVIYFVVIVQCIILEILIYFQVGLYRICLYFTKIRCLC